ncbi:MAG: choice-of-anchor D domain-containing protein [Dehalococcoidia bacterium]|jgi:flagellin FlaB
MKASTNFFKNQQGMTGLETAIILIAFVTVAAVFGYAVLSAGLFSAEQGKSTIYAGLNEAKSNLELSGSVVAKSDDSINVRSILFTVKDAIAGNPIDMTPNDGSGHNKCVISLKTNSDYINDVKWSFVPIGADNGNNLLETGEQFEITVDLTDLGSAGSLSENLTANQTFTLQVKPSVGSSITIQRTLPPAIGPVMDLDLMTDYGGGHSASENASGGGGGTQQAISINPSALGFGSVLVSQTSNQQAVTVSNTGTANLAVGAITLSGANADQFTIASDTASNQTIAPGASRIVNVTFNPASAGAKYADLSIPSNDPVNNPVTVALSGDGTTPLTCTRICAYWYGGPSLTGLDLWLKNTGTDSANISQSGVTIAVDGGTAVVPNWEVSGDNPFAPGVTCIILINLTTSPVVVLPPGHTVTVTITPDGGSALPITRTIPGSGSLHNGYFTDLP